MSPVTQRAIELCRAGFSPSEATAFAVQGTNLCAAAVQRVESIVCADLIRCERERSARRCA